MHSTHLPTLKPFVLIQRAIETMELLVNHGADILATLKCEYDKEEMLEKLFIEFKAPEK